VLVIIAAVGAGIGAGLHGGAQPEPKAAPAAAAPQPRVDAEGVPLPPGALARFGSSRMRHADAIYSLAFSPDGRAILSAAGDGTRIWDTTTGKVIHQFADDGGWGRAMCYSADGREVLTVCGDKPASLVRRNAATGMETLRVELRDDDRFGNAFAPDGRRLAVSWRDKTIRLYDTSSGKETQNIPYVGSTARMAFSPDGHQLAVVESRDVITLHDTSTGRKLGELQRDGANYSIVTFAPDGRTLAALTAADRGLATEIDLWDAPARKHLRRITGPDVHSAIHIAFSPDGKLLAQTSQNPDVVLWDVVTGQEVRRMRTYPSVTVAAFSPDGRTLAAASAGGAITLWDVATGKLLQPSADPIIGVFDLRFTDGGRQLVGTSERLRAWEIATGRAVDRFAPLTSRTTFRLPVLSADQRLIAERATPRDDGPSIRLWDAQTGRLVRSIEGIKSYWPATAFTPDSRRLIAGGVENVIQVFDVADGKELGRMTGHARVSRLAVTPDGRRLASASSDASARGDYAVRLWDLQTYKELRRFVPRRGSVFDMSFSPDGRRLATAGGEPGRLNNRGEVQVWDVESGREIRALEGHAERVSRVQFSPDGRIVVTGSLDRTIRLWELATGAERERITGHRGTIYSVTFSPHGRLLAASSPDAPVYLWDVYARSEAHPPPTPADVDRLWTDLAAADAQTAFRAIRRLVNAPDAAVALLRERLLPVPAADAGRVKELIAKLDASKFADRHAAAKELIAVADPAAEQLRTALAETKSAEVRQSLQAILDRLEAGTPEILRALRAVEILEQIGIPAACEHLKALAGGAAGATLTHAATDALGRLEQR
jgi:WD40 repeat protein